jgi:hypothetical protein
MITVLFAIAALLIPVGAILFVVILLLSRALLERLKKHHAAEYKELGEPRLFAARQTQVALRSFVFDRQDRALNDARLSNIVSASLGAYYAFVACSIYVFICLVVRTLGIHGL